MAYDAGAIEASATVDKEPFRIGIDQLIKIGEDFGRRTFTASADFDIRQAEQALDRIKAKTDNFGRQKYTAKVDVDVTGNVRFDALIRKAEQFNGTTYRAKVVLDAEIAFLKLDVIEARLAALGAGKTVHTVEIRYTERTAPNLPSRIPGGARTVGGGSSADTGQFSPLGTAIVGLGPALIPLLPLAGALVGELGTLGVVGLLAFKGITSEMKAGTAQGQEYARGVGQIKTDLTGLEATAARNLLSPFSRDVVLLNQQMPFLNEETGKYARLLGNTGDQLFRGGISALHILDPLLTQVSGWVYNIAAGFNHWASDGGLQRFEDRALQVLPTIEHDVEDIATVLLRVVEAAGPFGMHTLEALDLISRGLNSLPLPVLQTLVTLAGSGYLAFQAWRGLAPVIGVVQKLTASIKAYEVEQLMAAGMSKAAATEQATLSGGLQIAAARYGSLALAAGLTGAALLGTYAIVQAIHKENVATADSAGDAAKQLTHMAESGEVLQSMLKSFGVRSTPGLAGGYGDLNSVLENAFKESNWTKIKDFTFGLPSLFNTATTSSKNFFKSMDDGLTQLVVQGDKATAQNAFKIISDQAAKQGVTVDQLLSKLPHYKDALAAINAQASGPIVGLNGVLMATSGSLDTLAGKYGLTGAQAQNYAGILGITADQVKESTVSQQRLAQVVDVVNAAERTGTQTTSEYLAAVDKFAQSAGTAADRGALIGATLKAANGDALGYANTMVAVAVANQQVVSGFDKQQRAAINLKTGAIDYRNAAAGPLLQSLQSLQTAAMNAAGATYQHELSIKGAKAASDDAVIAYYSQTHGALTDEAKQLGLTKDQAKRLADQYFSLPKDIRTKIEAIGTDPVVKILDQIGRQLAYLTGHRWVSQFDADTSAAVSRIQQLGRQIAGVAGHRYNVYFDAHTTGTIPQGGNQASLSARGNLFRPYAYGGFDDVPNAHMPAVYPVRPDGRARVFAEPETHGEAYIPLANDYRRPRAQAITAETARLLGGAAFFADGGFGFVGVQGPSSSGGGSGGSRGGGSGGSGGGVEFNGRLYSSLTSAEAARASLGDSLAKALGGELSGIGKLATATVATVDSALSKILATVRQAVTAGFGPSRLVASMQAETRQIAAEVAARVRLTSQLATQQKALAATRALAATAQSDVAAAVMGGFDIGTAGNGYAYGISSTLDQRVADAQKFEQLSRQAQSLGLDKNFIDQMLREGPATAGANLQAIVTAGTSDRGYITHLNQQRAALVAAAQGVGAQDANALYGSQLVAQESAVSKTAAQQLAEQRAINKNLATLAAQVRALDATVARQAAEAHRLATIRAQTRI